jgi:hypothetical protein
MIQSLYKLAYIPAWDGEVNEDVARVFGIMLAETQKCSKAFVWVPTPPGWPGVDYVVGEPAWAGNLSLTST